MASVSDPVLLVVGRQAGRLRWLIHHLTSHWPHAAVRAVGGTDSATLCRSMDALAADAVLLGVDSSADTIALELFAALRRGRPDVPCIVLAENGSAAAAAPFYEAGAKGYLALARITREMLLGTIEAVIAARQTAWAAGAVRRQDGIAPAFEIPGFTLISEISAGQFSAVFLARSERLRRNVVLKIVRRGRASLREIEEADRFMRETEIISSISHRSIAEVHEFGAVGEQQFLAMEHVPCGNLAKRLCNPLSVDGSLFYLRAIAEALRVIHAFGILHRDLKPANVMLREDDSPVLIDFGLARRAAEEPRKPALGFVFGSPYYISPEQARGLRLDARTDLYSLGVMFHEMLTGCRPYTGRTARAIMKQHANAAVPRLPAHAVAQQALLDRLMAKIPSERYASADELLADLGPSIAAVA